MGATGRLYLAAILDVFSRFVVGWALSAVNDRPLTITALAMARTRRCPEVGLVHHSDQGRPYAGADDQAGFAANGITGSMSRRGNCDDHAVMAASFSSVKNERGEHFVRGGGAKTAVFEYIEVLDNQRRRHSTLGYMSPAGYERRASQGPMARDAATPNAAECADHGGIVQAYPAGDRRSWGILGGRRFSDRRSDARLR